MVSVKPSLVKSRAAWQRGADGTLRLVVSCTVLSCLVAYHVTWQRCRIWATKVGIFFFCSSCSSAGVPSRVTSPIRLTTHCHTRSSSTWFVDFVILWETSSVPGVNSCCANEEFLQEPIRFMSLQRFPFDNETEYVQGRRFLINLSSVMRRRKL
jgi:hypothetical protein